MKCLEQCEVWAISYLGQQVVSLTEGNIWTNSTKSNKLAVNFTLSKITESNLELGDEKNNKII